MIGELLEQLRIHGDDLLAVIWFLICFRGYFRYTASKIDNTPSLAYAMHKHRQQWIRQAMVRENRIADTNIIGNHERNVAFFASASLLILAGLATVLGSSDAVTLMLDDLPFADGSSPADWELKILLMVFLFVYAFFKFTWALRQYDMASVMLGGAPEAKEKPSEDKTERYVDAISRMISKGGGNFNNGLRTFYFSMSVLGWFVNPWVFIALASLTVAVLYRREFKSDTLEILMLDLPR